jgi:hypothetical protein
VAGRALAFADDENIRLVREQFVPVAGDDWYERRRDDAEGRFFRGVADQGPRKGEGGSTRQGIYCLTADGKLLAYRNSQQPESVHELLLLALKEWDKLPPERRLPGAIKVEDPEKSDARYARQPPPGGLVVAVYSRILEADAKGIWCKGSCPTKGGDLPARDHLWLTKEDCQALIPRDPKKGDIFPLPASLAERLARFHLIDNTRGEPPMWKHDEIRENRLTLTVEEASPGEVSLKLEGTVLLASKADVSQADRGFDVRILGQIHYDAVKKGIDRFDLVALGEHWGQGAYTAGARPGRTPLGIVFELTKGEQPGDRIPPQAARDIDTYLGTGR